MTSKGVCSALPGGYAGHGHRGRYKIDPYREERWANVLEAAQIFQDTIRD